MNVDEMVDAWSGDDPDFESEPFAAEDLAMVGRWQRKMQRIDTQLMVLAEACDAEHARIEAVWLEAKEATVKQRAWLEQSCVRFHEAILRRDPNRLTIVGPNGTLKAHAQRPEWLWADETAFVAWAREHADAGDGEPDPWWASLLRQPPIPDLAPAKQAAVKLLTVPKGQPGDVVTPVTKDGETVPGVTVLYRPRKHDVIIGHTDSMDGRTDEGYEPE